MAMLIPICRHNMLKDIGQARNASGLYLAVR